MDLALAWLTKHALLPRGVTAHDVTVTYLPGRTDVRFAPSTLFPLAADQAGLDISVGFDTAGNVIYAHRLWPVVTQSGVVSLRSAQSLAGPTPPSVASTPSQGATAQSMESRVLPPVEVQIQSIALVYVPKVSGSTVTLQPYYKLEGQIVGPKGAHPTVTQLIPASAAKPAAGATP
jgi:hypothetical protein